MLDFLHAFLPLPIPYIFLLLSATVSYLLLQNLFLIVYCFLLSVCFTFFLQFLLRIISFKLFISSLVWFVYFHIYSVLTNSSLLVIWYHKKRSFFIYYLLPICNYESINRTHSYNWGSGNAKRAGIGRDELLGIPVLISVNPLPCWLTLCVWPLSFPVIIIPDLLT